MSPGGGPSKVSSRPGHVERRRLRLRSSTSVASAATGSVALPEMSAETPCRTGKLRVSVMPGRSCTRRVGQMSPLRGPPLGLPELAAGCCRSCVRKSPAVATVIPVFTGGVDELQRGAGSSAACWRSAMPEIGLPSPAGSAVQAGSGCCRCHRSCRPCSPSSPGDSTLEGSRGQPETPAPTSSHFQGSGAPQYRVDTEKAAVALLSASGATELYAHVVQRRNFPAGSLRSTPAFRSSSAFRSGMIEPYGALASSPLSLPGRPHATWMLYGEPLTHFHDQEV